VFALGGELALVLAYGTDVASCWRPVRDGRQISNRVKIGACFATDVWWWCMLPNKGKRRGVRSEEHLWLVRCRATEISIINTTNTYKIYVAWSLGLFVECLYYRLQMTTVSPIRSDISCPLPCLDRDCGQTFANPNAFFEHWKRHIRCPFPSCVKSVKSKFDFERHCQRKHVDYFPELWSVKKTACKHHCGKLFTKANVSNLKRHEKTCRGNQDQT
jgi:hypothetical protein